jgi:hypothetical protein
LLINVIILSLSTLICRILYFCAVRKHLIKTPVLIMLAMMLGGWLLSSCKKTDQTLYVNVFLASERPWQLASQQVSLFYGDTLKRTDTLNRGCTLNQVFDFDNDGTCTYQNYGCRSQSAKGTWQISPEDQPPVLRSNVNLEDATGSSQPFALTRIINLGQNSLVLESTIRDTLRRKPNTVLRSTVTRYAFIH